MNTYWVDQPIPKHQTNSPEATSPLNSPHSNTQSAITTEREDRYVIALVVLPFA